MFTLEKKSSWLVNRFYKILLISIIFSVSLIAGQLIVGNFSVPDFSIQSQVQINTLDPRARPLVNTCADLGYDFGRPDMVINAGQASIALPSRTNRIELNTAPATLNQANTEYVLTADVTTELTAFTINANNITLNLNGHRINYGTNDSPPVTYPNGTAGVKMVYGLTGIVIANGVIVQGSGSCRGDIAGRNCNPVQFSGGRGKAEIGGLRVEYHSPDTNGLLIGNTQTDLHHNTLVDSGTVVTYAGTGVPVIDNGLSAGSKIHHNLIQGARHRGIVPGNNAYV